MFKNKTVEEKKAFKEKVMIGVAGLGVGIVAGCVISKHGTAINNGIKQGIAIMINSPVTNNTTINNVTNMVKRGHAGNITICNETGEKWASQNEAAKALSISASRLSEHLNGKTPHIKGMTFTSEGEFPTT